jgi:hypothetical protein
VLVLTILLVVAGLALLLVGSVRDDLTLIYLSIGCTAIAGVVLIVFSQQRRRRVEREVVDGGSGVGPEDAPPSGPVTTADDGRPMPSGPPEGTGDAGPPAGGGTGDAPTAPPGGGTPAAPG